MSKIATDVTSCTTPEGPVEAHDILVEAARLILVAAHGEVMTTSQMQEKYEVVGFGGGYCVVERRSDGKRGSLDFSHSPRFYYGFQEG